MPIAYGTGPIPGPVPGPVPVPVPADPDRIKRETEKRKNPPTSATLARQSKGMAIGRVIYTVIPSKN